MRIDPRFDRGKTGKDISSFPGHSRIEGVVSEDTAVGGEKSDHPVGESPCEGEKHLSAREMKVMAALARRPFGLRSIADIARASGVPPATAGRILRRLQDDDLVRLHRRMLADWGRAKEGTVWVLTVSPRVL